MLAVYRRYTYSLYGVVYSISAYTVSPKSNELPKPREQATSAESRAVRAEVNSEQAAILAPSESQILGTLDYPVLVLNLSCEMCSGASCVHAELRHLTSNPDSIAWSRAVLILRPWN